MSISSHEARGGAGAALLDRASAGNIHTAVHGSSAGGSKHDAARRDSAGAGAVAIMEGAGRENDIDEWSVIDGSGTLPAGGLGASAGHAGAATAAAAAGGGAMAGAGTGTSTAGGQVTISGDALADILRPISERMHSRGTAPAAAAAGVGIGDAVRRAAELESKHEIVALVGRSCVMNWGNWNRFRESVSLDEPTMVVSFLGAWLRAGHVAPSSSGQATPRRWFLP
jgi:hypothetical protein